MDALIPRAIANAPEPMRSWLARRSTIATLTFANANSPAKHP